jgi:hypothetical protein
MNLEQDLIKASALGKSAFLADKCSTPAFDANLTELWKPYRGDTKSIIQIMEAWIKAWHAENLKN